MPGTNAGTGQPLYFMCHVERRAKWRIRDNATARAWLHERHSPIVRTGKIRRNVGGNTRTLSDAYQYRCACGHVGWTRHRDILNSYYDPS